MIDTKLILVEGSIGSGKTTTAENLTRKINESGAKAIWYHENAPDNPLNTYMSRLLQENYGRQFDLASAIKKFHSHDSGVDTIPLWSRLAEQCRIRDEITVIESRFWQHETMYWFLLEFDPTSIVKRQQEIAEIISATKPFLVYLGNDDVATVIKNAFLTRPVEWQQWDLWLFGEFPYFKTHNLTGIDGFIEFYKAWNLVADDLFKLYPYSKVELRNPHDDWSAATEKLNLALELVVA